MDALKTGALQLYLESLSKLNKIPKRVLLIIKNQILQKLNRSCCGESYDIPVLECCNVTEGQQYIMMVRSMLPMESFKSLRKALRLVNEMIHGGKCCVPNENVPT